MHSVSTTYSPKQTNHLLHLILTFATCGLWGVVWVGMVIVNALSKDKHTTVQSGGIYNPYAVGPGAPVSAQNPLPGPGATPPMQMPPYVGYGGAPTDMTRRGYPLQNAGELSPEVQRQVDQFRESTRRHPPRERHYEEVAAEPPLHSDENYSPHERPHPDPGSPQ